MILQIFMNKDRFGQISDKYECCCSSPYHRLVMGFDVEGWDETCPPEPVFDFFIPKLDFWHRLKEGFKYILGFKPQLNFETFMLSPCDVPRLQKALDKFIESHDVYIDKNRTTLGQQYKKIAEYYADTEIK